MILMGAYKRVRNKVNALNMKLKKKHFTMKMQSCEGNMKETWATINKLINRRSKTTTITSIVADVFFTEADGVADSMNKYFCSIGRKIPSNVNSFISENFLNVKTSFSFSPLTPERLTRAAHQSGSPERLTRAAHQGHVQV